MVTTAEKKIFLDSNTTTEYDYLNRTLPGVLLFLFVTSLLGVLIRSLLKKWKVLHPALLAMFGIIWGLMSYYFSAINALTVDMGNVNPITLMHLFIPALIFNAAFDLELYAVKKAFGQVLLLAIPGTLINASLTGVFVVNILTHGFTWYEGMIVGSIASATDPILSTIITRDIDLSHISILLGAEALFNDSTCSILYEIFKDILSLSEMDTAGQEVAIHCVLKFFGSPLLGYITAKLVMLWLYHVANDETTEVAISLTVVYLTFYAAEWASMSGVIAVSFFGLTLDIVAFTPGTEFFLHRFWEILTSFSNIMVFALVGFEIGDKAFSYVEPMDAFYICILYIGVFSIRALSVSLLSIWLSRIGYGFSWRTGVVVVWGGMRGAFTLNLALYAYQEQVLDTFIRSKAFLLIAGITILNLWVNAFSMNQILGQLGFCDISSAKRMAMYSIILRLRQSGSTTLSMLKMDRFLADANWNMVETATMIEDPYQTSERNVTLEELFPELLVIECPDCMTDGTPEPTPREIADMVDEARLRMLKAQVISYWKQYNAGMLNRETTRILVSATENYVDRRGKFMNIYEVKKCWQDKGISVFLRRKLETWVYSKEKDDLAKPPQKKVLKICYDIVNTNEFEFIIYLCISMAIFPVVLFFIPTLECIYENELQIVNYCFMVFFAGEACIKILGLRKFYFLNRWHQLDFFILVINLLEMVAEWILQKKNGNRTVSSVIRALRLLRLLRAVRLLKVLMPKIIVLLNKQINKKLSCGYDIAKGFVMSEEDVKSIVDQLSDNKKITEKLKTVIETDRQDGMQELGLLQRDNPEIVTAAKTSQAIRTVLNCIWETLQGLRAGGIVDRFQGFQLEQIIQLKVQELATFPTTIATSNAEELLRNVPWLENSKKENSFIKSRAKILFFDYGDVICREGDPPRGIHLVVFGLVKLYGSGPLFGHNNEYFEEEKENNFKDFRGVGTLLGEVNCLTRQSMEISITCDTAVQTCFIGINDLYEAFEMFHDFPSLEYKIWLSIAIRTALVTFKDTLAYQTWSSNKLYSWLAFAFLEDIEIHKKYDVYDGRMEDAVLVYGSLKDCQLLVPYYAPFVIPKTSHQVQGTAETTKLLIVPTSGQEHIAASKSGMVKGCSGAPCLQHSATRRRKRTGKASISISKRDSITMLSNIESATRVKTFHVDETAYKDD